MESGVLCTIVVYSEHADIYVLPDFFDVRGCYFVTRDNTEESGEMYSRVVIFICHRCPGKRCDVEAMSSGQTSASRIRINFSSSRMTVAVAITVTVVDE